MSHEAIPAAHRRALDSMVQGMTPEQHRALQRAVELGKWPDGRRLDPAERELALQVLIAHDFRHKPEAERIGHVPVPSDECEHDHPDEASRHPDVIARSAS